MNPVDVTPFALLKIGGIAATASIFLQLFVKPLLSNWKEHSYYNLLLNALVTIIAVGLAIVGLYMADVFKDSPTFIFAAFQGVIAAYMAIYGYEVLKNLNATFGGLFSSGKEE